MLKFVKSYPILSLFAFVAIMLGFTIDNIPVSIMEARNFISAREMLSDNHWILTTMNGEARYEKPPLPTWITAFFGFFFGIKTVLILRLPALLFLALTGVLTYLLSKKLSNNKQHSLLTGFIVITSFYVIGITVEAPWDIYTHGFMLMALYHLFQLLNAHKMSPKNGILFSLFFAASILSKGPIGIYALFLPFVIAYGIVFKFKGGILKYLKLISLLVFGLLIGGWWYFYVRIADPEAFIRITTKETANWSSYKVKPFYYYWSFFTQSGLWTIPAFIGLLYPYMKSRVGNLKAYKFSFYWTIIAVILLSVIPEKKSRYLMPVLIPLAINTGFYLDYLIRNFKQLKDKKETVPVYFNFGLIGVISLLFPIIGFFFGSFLTGLVLIRFIIASIILVIIGFFILKRLKQKNMSQVVGLTFMFMMCAGLLLIPFSNIQTNTDYHPISKLEDNNVLNSIPLYGLHYVSPEVIYNYGKKIPILYSEEGLRIPEEGTFIMLTTSIKEDLISIDELSSLYAIEHLGTYNMNRLGKERKRLINKLYRLKRK
jgi:4-amino-4-deoxy-L-arabinose transferase-like glycosyltransferase